MHGPLEINENIFSLNKRIAEENRKLLTEKKTFAVNLMGAIGSGKTILIEKLSAMLPFKCGAIAGDVVSDLDANRFKEKKLPCVGINTGKSCHLDAHVVQHALQELPLEKIDVLFIENVGNLICPADFDLGEHLRIVIVSVSEGDDIIAKHPVIFKESHAIIINKVDIAEAVNASAEKMATDAHRLNPNAKVFITSIKTGTGLKEIKKWLEEKIKSWGTIK